MHPKTANSSAMLNNHLMEPLKDLWYSFVLPAVECLSSCRMQIWTSLLQTGYVRTALPCSLARPSSPLRGARETLPGIQAALHSVMCWVGVHWTS